jgi:hypothetical protein
MEVYVRKIACVIKNDLQQNCLHLHFALLPGRHLETTTKYERNRYHLPPFTLFPNGLQGSLESTVVSLENRDQIMGERYIPRTTSSIRRRWSSTLDGSWRPPSATGVKVHKRLSVGQSVAPVYKNLEVLPLQRIA